MNKQFLGGQSRNDSGVTTGWRVKLGCCIGRRRGIKGIKTVPKNERCGVGLRMREIGDGKAPIVGCDGGVVENGVGGVRSYKRH